MLGLAKRALRRCEVSEADRGPGSNEKDTHPAVLRLIVSSLGRSQFATHLDDFRCIHVDSFGLCEIALGGDKVSPFDGSTRPVDHGAELGAVGTGLRDFPARLSDLGKSRSRLFGILQSGFSAREVTQGCKATRIGNQVSCLADL